VREAFDMETKHLLALPDNPYHTDEQVAVRLVRQPYARFDLNDYSVPHDYVQRTLTVVSSLQEVAHPQWTGGCGCPSAQL